MNQFNLSFDPVEVLQTAAALVAERGLNPEGEFMNKDGVPCIHGAVIAALGVPEMELYTGTQKASVWVVFDSHANDSEALLDGWWADESNGHGRTSPDQGREWAANLFAERIAYYQSV
jgi:hypothetical protein